MGILGQLDPETREEIRKLTEENMKLKSENAQLAGEIKRLEDKLAERQAKRDR